MGCAASSPLPEAPQHATATPFSDPNPLAASAVNELLGEEAAPSEDKIVTPPASDSRGLSGAEDSGESLRSVLSFRQQLAAEDARSTLETPDLVSGATTPLPETVGSLLRSPISGLPTPVSTRESDTPLTPPRALVAPQLSSMGVPTYALNRTMSADTARIYGDAGAIDLSAEAQPSPAFDTPAASLFHTPLAPRSGAGSFFRSLPLSRRDSVIPNRAPE